MKPCTNGCYWLCGEGPDCEVLGKEGERLVCANLSEMGFSYAGVIEGRLCTKGDEFLCWPGFLLGAAQCQHCPHWSKPAPEDRLEGMEDSDGFCNRPGVDVSTGVLVVTPDMGCVLHETDAAHEERVKIMATMSGASEEHAQ